MARTLKHKLDDGREVEIPLPEGYLTPDEIEGFVPREQVEKIVGARAAQAKRSAMKELLDDEEFRSQALAKWGIPTDVGKGGKPDTDAITAALKDYERQHVEPLKKEIAGRDEKIGKLLKSRLASEILAAAAGSNAKKSYLKPLPGSSVPAIVQIFGEAFGFDEDSGEFFVRNTNGNGFAVSGVADAPHPWKTPGQFFTELAKSKEYADFFEPAGQSGASVRGPGAGNPAPAGSVSRNDPLAFGRAAKDVVAGKVTVTD